MDMERRLVMTEKRETVFAKDGEGRYELVKDLADELLPSAKSEDEYDEACTWLKMLDAMMCLEEAERAKGK
jgi:hypothetical protein